MHPAHREIFHFIQLFLTIKGEHGKYVTEVKTICNFPYFRANKIFIATVSILWTVMNGTTPGLGQTGLLHFFLFNQASAAIHWAAPPNEYFQSHPSILISWIELQTIKRKSSVLLA